MTTKVPMNLADNGEPLNISVPTAVVTASGAHKLTNRIPCSDYERFWFIIIGTATSGNASLSVQANEYAASSGGSGTAVGDPVVINDTGEIVVLDVDVSKKDAYLDLDITPTGGTNTTIGIAAIAFKKPAILSSNAYSYTMPVSAATALTDAAYGPITT